MDAREAFGFLSSLRVGDPVRVTEYGRTYDMVVTRGPHREDFGRGGWEGMGVTVSLGPGMWSTRISAQQFRADSIRNVTIERREDV